MKKLLLITVISLFVVLMSSSLALAYHKGATNIDPHQQYGLDPLATPTDSDFCLQCHDMHAAAGAYALMLKATVTDTCGTCHSIYQVAPSGAHNPGYPGQEAGPPPGTSSALRVYEAPLSAKATHEGHRLAQSGAITFASGPGTNTVEVSPFSNSVYSSATADFIPGSGYPGVATYKYLNRISSWSAFTAGADMSGYLSSGNTATGGLYCASCHSPHGTIRGSALDGGMTNNKLLSSRPNHRTVALTTAGWTSWTDNGNNWCEVCHAQRGETTPPDGTTPHNHPSQFCLQCHADNAAVAPDFPHTGAQNLLSEYPDQLCVGTCHAFGLP